METSGRERRHRYYTVANYLKLVSEEALDKSSACFTDIDLVNIGRFYSIRSDSFYENDKELVHRQDAAKDVELVRGSEPKLGKFSSVSNSQPKRGRPRKPISIQEQCNSSAKRKRKGSPLSDDGVGIETSGSEESSTKRRRLNGTGKNTAGMLFLSVIHSSSFTDVSFSGIQRNEAGHAKLKIMVLISPTLYRGKRGVVQVCERRFRTYPCHPQYKVTLILTLVNLVHPLLEPQKEVAV